MLQLTAIISVDAFGGGFIFNALILTNCFGDTMMESGPCSSRRGCWPGAAPLLAVPISRRIGLACSTMFCGRAPASLLLFLAALAPNFGIATAYLTLCGSLLQLDVPTLAAIDLSQSGRKSGRTR